MNILPFYRWSRLVVVVGPLALAACHVGLDYKRPDITPPASWASAGDTTDSWPSVDWWHNFGSPQLDAYMAEAGQANFDLAAAIARVREADAQARVAGAALLPSLQLNVTAAHERGIGTTGLQTFTQYSPGVSASYELDFWGKNRAAADAAIATANASRYDQVTVQLTVLSSVANTYFQVLELKGRLAVAENNLNSAQSTLDGLHLQQSAGIIAALDVAQQETTVLTISATIPPIRQQLRQSIDALAILVGRSPEAIDIAPASLADITRPSIKPGLPSVLLARRPDVAEAEAQLISANANITVARASFFPSIDLTASGGFASTALSKALDPSHGIFSFAASLTQPIFEGGALEGQYAYSQARYDELVADYRKSVLSAFGNVEDALVAVQQTTEQEAREENAAGKARQANEIAQAQLHAGTINILTVLNTETALFSTEDALVQAKFLRLQALVNLYTALGGGWQA